MIITHLDHNYVEWGVMYLKAVKSSNPDERVYISSANLSEQQLDVLRKSHDSLVIENHFYCLPSDVKWRRFMQCRISKVLLDSWIHAKEGELCLATDSDMLILQSLNDLWSLMEGKDVGLYLEPSRMSLVPPQILNGVIAFRGGDARIYNFFLEYEKMWRSGRVQYFDDQRVLYKAYYKFKECLEFATIPCDYADGNLEDGSHIWSAHKGSRFNRYKVFRKRLGLSDVTECPNIGWQLGTKGCSEEYIRKNKGDGLHG